MGVDKILKLEPYVASGIPIFIRRFLRPFPCDEHCNKQEDDRGCRPVPKKHENQKGAK